MTLSSSQLNLFLSCPYAWKLVYVDGVEKYEYGGQYAEEGSLIHKIIERYYKTAPREVTPREVKLHLAIAARKVGTSYEQVRWKLDSFQKFEVERIKNRMKLIGVEMDMTDGTFRGVIDALFERNRRRWVLDWKSGYQGSLERHHLIQGAIYKILTGADKVFFLFLGSRKLIELDQKLAESELNKALRMFDEATKTGMYERRIGDACTFCPVSVRCNSEREGITLANF